MGNVVKVDFKQSGSKKDSKAKKPTGKKKIYQLKISLAGSKPQIWRRVLVAEDITLRKLHNIIQIVMGWTDTHLHEFIIDGISYADPDPEMEMYDSKNETRARLNKVAPYEKTSFKYIYDFGDNWEHKITVEKILDHDERFTGRPVCIAGKLSAPPEDCGSIYGYYAKLEILKNTKDPDYEKIRDWMGEGFDVEAFDIEDINEEFGRVR